MYIIKHGYMLQDRDNKDMMCFSHAVFAVYEWNRDMDIVNVKGQDIPCCVCAMSSSERKKYIEEVNP